MHGGKTWGKYLSTSRRAGTKYLFHRAKKGAAKFEAYNSYLISIPEHELLQAQVEYYLNE
jgi:hypothetical protein